jgi:hypothetical protein
MALVSGRLPVASAFVPHTVGRLAHGLTPQAGHPATAHVSAISPLIMLAGYLLPLIFLLVFGIFRGWEKRGGGGNGGGGGPYRPGERKPTPPGGRQLDTREADDFGAWELELDGIRERAESAYRLEQAARQGRSRGSGF